MSLGEFFETYQLLISVVLGLIGFLFTYFLERYLVRRKEKEDIKTRLKTIASENLIERLLPFYNDVLKIQNKLDLLGKTQFKFKLLNLNDEIQDLYEDTGKVFFVIENPEQRQLILDSLQLLELFRDALEHEIDIMKLNEMRANLIKNFGYIKQVVEEDLFQYKSIADFPKFEDKTVIDSQGNYQMKNKFILDYIKQLDKGKK